MWLGTFSDLAMAAKESCTMVAALAFSIYEPTYSTTTALPD